MAKKLKSLNPIIGTGYKTLSTIKDGEDGNIENFPDTLPKIPRLSYKRLGVSGLEIGWEFEDKIYYTYELYGSTTKGFEASEENLIFQGLASSYFYEAKPGEKWYFKARAKNTHGRYTEFSSELVAYTVKLDNLGEYVEGGAINGALIENATINNAHIKDLHADKITAGVLDADRIGANSITSEKIQANSIETNHLKASVFEAVDAKIQNAVIDKATIADLTAINANIDKLTANKAEITELEAVKADIGSLTAGKADIGMLDSINANIEILNAGYAKIEDLDVNKANIEDLNATNATIENLKADVADIDKLVANKADITDLNATNANIEKLVAKDAQIENLISEKADISQLNATNANIGTLTANLAQVENLVAQKANIGDLNAANANIENLKAGQAEIEVLVASKASINDLKATNANVENLKAGQAEIEVLVAQKANIGDLNATNANVENLKAGQAEIEVLVASKASIEDLKSTNASIGQLQANKADITELNVAKGEITQLKSEVAEIGTLKGEVADIEHILAGNIGADNIAAGAITSDKIQTGAITAGSGIIANGAIGSAQISSIDAGKISTGTVDTSKVTIQGTNGHLKIKGNRLQVFNGTGSNAKERVSLGDVNGNGSVYGLRVRGADGTTILLDENGVKSEGITDGAITNDKISDDANIDGAKLNINSVVNKINEDGTETIQGTKIEVDGTRLNTKLSTITNKQNADGERITQAQSQITANTNAIKLKVDEQTYTTDKKDMTSKLEKNTSEISAMKGQIALKVEQADIENAISNIEVGNRNLLLGTGTEKTIVGENKENQCIHLYSFENGNNHNLKNATLSIRFKYQVSEGAKGIFKLQTNGSANSSLGETGGYWLTLSPNTNVATHPNKTITNVVTVNCPNNKGFNGVQARLDNFVGTITIEEVTMVEGNTVITDWTPSPKDIERDVDTKINTAKAEIKVTTDAISQNISNLSQTVSTKADGSTVTSINNKVSSLETSVNGISGKVTNLESTTTTLNGKVADAQTTANNAVSKANSAQSTANTANSTANANKSNITNLQGEIATVKSDMASLEVTTSGISQKVSSVEKTTTTLQADLSSTTTKANNALNKAESANSIANTNKGNITSLQGEINTVKSNVASLEVTTNGISQKVSSVESTTSTLTSKVNTVESTANQAKTSAESANNKVDNMSIGGRNLAQSTSSSYSSVFNSFTGTTNTCPSLAKVLTDGLSVGDTVTVKLIYKYKDIVPASGQTASCWIQGSGDVTSWNRGTFAGSPRKTLTGSGEHTFLYSFKINDNHLENTYWNTNIRHDYVQSGSVQWKMFKVEKGNKATDWTPAPEDVNGAINSVDGKVATLQGEYDTTKSKVATIETNLDGITQRVSSTETTTATLTNKVSDAQNTANSAINKANNAQSTANTANSTANANKSNITNLQGEVSTVKSDIASLEVTTSGISQKVSSVESTTASLSTQVTTAQNTANSAQSTANSANSNATNALNKANDANILASSKAKVFTSTPTVPYQVGDLWVQGTNGDVMKCKTARTSGSYTASDWEKASKYTDDTKANSVDSKVTNLQTDYNSTKSKVATLETNLDGITQRVSSTESTTTTLTAQVSTAQNTANKAVTDASNAQSTANTANTNATSAINKANTAQSTADSKAKVFTSTPTVPYKVGDLWVQGTSGDVMRCKTARSSGSYNSADWEKASKYTDDTKANAVDSKVTNLQTEYNKTKSQVAEIVTDLNGITQRVSNTESTTATLTTKVNNAQSTADSAKTTATNAQSTANSANSKIDSLKIGTRNLLKGTSSELKSVTFSGWDYYFPNNLTSWTVGEQLTGRVYIKPTNEEASCMLHVRYTDSTYNQYRGNIIKAGAEGYSTVTATVNPPSGKTVSHIQFSIRHSASSTPSDVVYYKEPKVESGNKPSSWSPAPEDVDSSISAVDGKVTTLQGTVNTTNSKVATLETNLNGITQRVSSTESTTATLTTKVDNAQSTANTAKSTADSAKTTATNAQNTANTANSNATNALNTANSTNTKLNNLQIGGRNLIRKADVAQNNSTATFNESTKTWTIKANAGAGGTWGCGLVLRNRNILVPYGKSYVLSFEIKVPRNCSWNIDVNNYALTGSSWAGNDNDNVSKRSTSSNSLTANQWIKCWAKWENTNANNSNKVDLCDNSNFGVVMQNETSDMTYEIRNIQGELGNIPTEYTPAPEDVDGAINSVDGKVTTLQGTVNTTNSKVATLETNLQGITQRVSSTESTTATLTTKVDNVESTANTAKSTADTANNNATNALNTANSTNTKLNNLQVGGRNLALGTGKATGDVSSGNSGSPYSATDLFSGITAIKTNAAWTGRFFNLKAIARRGGFKAGDNLVLSVYIKADQNVTLNVTSHRTTSTGNTAGSSKTYNNFTVTPKWQQVWFPFVADEGSLNREDTRIEVNVATGNNYIHWAGWKLEKGTKPSDWTPAPEDVQSQIDTHTTQITTTNNKVSSIETNLNSITSRVSATETTTSSLTSQINNKENKNDRVIYAKGNGNDAPNNSQVKVGSNTLVNGHGRGLNILALNPITLEQYYNGRFDTHGGDNYRTQFAEKIQELNNGNYIIVVTSHDSAGLNYATVCNALYLIGGSAPSTSISSYREAYALIGKSKLGKGNGLEMYIPKTATDARVAEVSVKVSDQGALLGVNSNNSESKIDTLTTRVSTAESKLTKDSLTTTIGSHYTTTSDVNGIVTSKGYATTSQVQQTKNELTATFKESGGYNRIRNGAFLTGDLTHWLNWGSCTKVVENSTDSGLGKVVKITTTGTNQGIQQTITGLAVNKKYTLSALVWASSGVGAIQVNNNGSYPSKTTTTTGVYEKLSVTFVAATTQVTVQLGRHGGGSNGTYYYTGVLLTEGDADVPWSPHPSEVYDGITTIDKNGVKVSQSNYNGYTQMKADGFYVNNGSENVISVTSSGATFKGKVTIQSGSSVPTSTLSGTISSNQLNSSITSDINNAKNNASSALSTANTAKNTADTAKSTADSAKSTATSAQSTANTASTNATNALNTANSVNNTVNSNKNNWNNAYNRVNEWAYGAVTGSTNINGGMIATNTITTNKLAVGDFTNISQIDENLAPNGNTVITHSDDYKYFRFGNDSSAGYHALQFATLNGGTFKVGDRFKFTFIGFGNKSISTAFIIRARYTDNTWNNLGSASYTFDTANKTRTVELQITSGLTAGKTLQRVTIFNEFNNTTGLAYMRNICINRMATGELIVDGAITANKIASRVINADKIVSGTITSNEIKAGTITSDKIASRTITADRIAAGVLTANEIKTGTITSDRIASRTITADRIAAGVLTANEIAANTITADKIASRTITADKIAAGAITANEIKSGTITATQMASNSVTADKIAAGAITANKIASGAITATMITSGTLDASKVNVTNLNASNIKSGKLSANYIDATNLSVKGELLSGQINGIGGMKFADGAIISSYDSHVHGYKGIQISAPSIKLGDKVDIYSPTLISTVTGKSSTSSTSSSWTMSHSGGLNCSTVNTTGTTTVGGTLNVRNNMINGMNNLQMGRGSVYIPIFDSNSNFDYIKGGRGTIAFADTGPIHFLYNGTKSSFIAGGTVYLPHVGNNVNCDHFRLGAGIMATPSSGSFHFLTANGNTSPLYAGVLYSATTLSLKEPMVMSNNSAFDKINSINVIETKNGLRLHNPISMVDAIDESSEVVKTVYNEEKDEIKTSIDYTSAISTLWKAVQELKQENDELKEIIKDIHSKL